MSLSLRCPHCQWPLLRDPALLQGDWSFLKCFNCGGFSMARNPDPIFERKSTSSLMPKVIAAKRRRPTPVPPPFIHHNHKTAIAVPLKAPSPLAPARAQKGPPRIPDPLPDLPARHSRMRSFLPLAAAASVTLGLMLFVQNWVGEKTKRTVARHSFKINPGPVVRTIKREQPRLPAAKSALMDEIDAASFAPKR